MLKSEVETDLAAKRDAVAATRQPVGAVDVTLPGRDLPLGRVHPLMRVRQQVEDIFTRMGYGQPIRDDEPPPSEAGEPSAP